MQVHISKKMIIDEINQIPDEKNDELYKLVHSFKDKSSIKNNNEALRKLLLKAPVWGDEELKRIGEVRKRFNEWKIEKF